MASSGQLPRGESFPVWNHLQMVADRIRVARFRSAIERLADPSGTLLEIGCGSGIFSIAAAAHFGRVIAIEQDSDLFQRAVENAERAGVGQRIVFLHADARQIRTTDLPGKPDVILCELLSTWLATEPFVEILNGFHGAIGGFTPTIPFAVSHLMELVSFDFEPEGIRLRAPTPQFEPITPAQPLSLPIELAVTRHDRECETALSRKARLDVLADGRATGLRLSNVAHLAPGVSLVGTSTIMQPMVVPLADDFEVLRGDNVSASVEVGFGRRLESGRFAVDPPARR